jgi:type IV pilus assembly protein PilV
MLITSPNKSKGFTLIEVLIALFVLAIGLLGMATLMMNSMQSSQGASQRSAATVAAYDLAERLRANRTQSAVAGSAYAGNPAAAVLPNCFTNPANITGCSNAETVALDRAQWSANLQGNIPGADAAVQQIDVNTFCLVIFWQEPGVAQTTSAPGDPCGRQADDRAYYSMQVTL